MQNKEESIIIKKNKTTNAERIKKWKALHLAKYLKDKKNINEKQ